MSQVIIRAKDYVNIEDIDADYHAGVLYVISHLRNKMYVKSRDNTINDGGVIVRHVDSGYAETTEYASFEHALVSQYEHIHAAHYFSSFHALADALANGEINHDYTI